MAPWPICPHRHLPEAPFHSPWLRELQRTTCDVASAISVLVPSLPSSSSCLWSTPMCTLRRITQPGGLIPNPSLMNSNPVLQLLAKLGSFSTPSAFSTPPRLLKFNSLLQELSVSLLPPTSPPPVTPLLSNPSPESSLLSALCSPLLQPPPGLVPCYSLSPEELPTFCLSSIPPNHSPK